MAFNQRSWYRLLFRTSHKILLETCLSKYFHLVNGATLVLGAGFESYRDVLPSASSIILTDIDRSYQDHLDKVVDAHHITYPDSTFDSVIAIEVFEHLSDPALASSEIFRILNTTGLCLISIPFMFRIHGDPYDFQRFTHSGIENLFREFRIVSVVPFGNRLHVIYDLLTTSFKLFVPFRIFNWLITLPPFSRPSLDCPSGYIVLLRK